MRADDALARLQYAAAPLMRREFSREYRRLMASQWWPAERLRELQERRLRSLLLHAWHNVPFYREQLDGAGLDPGTVTIERLRTLPFVDKATLQTRGSDMFSRVHTTADKGVYRNHSSGSTGEPVTFYQDRVHYIGSVAEAQRHYTFCGYRPGDRQAYLWASDPDSRDHNSVRGRLRDRLQNRVWINTYHATAADLRDAHRRLTEFEPALLVGYVSSLTMLASLMRDEGLAPLRPSAIQTCAEVLAPHQRQLLEDTFGRPVFDRYACREASTIAHECDTHDGLHIMAETALVEIVRESGEPAAPGELGHVVVTNLLNRVMPLIRYRVGDLAAAQAGACTCGRGLPRLARVEGRTSEVITAPNGRLLHAEFFTGLFASVPAVRQFHVEQTDPGSLLIDVVPGPGFDAGSLDSLVAAIHDRGDPAFQVECVLREAIPPTRSGKPRYTTSRVAPVLGSPDRG